ncbi:MAG: glycosyltransferase family 4 protein [Verrucomicrobia bacterium]|nr:glycosyltransferase family 4 protein [Verrucomicrobiota bacterium]
MASMVRGGGETFDLEMARQLAGLGCQVTFLTGIPLCGKANLGPESWWGDERWAVDDGQEGIINQATHCPSPIAHRTIRSPYFGWFPWDKTPGGWRLRVTDFKIFEWLAARWAFRHRDEFDVIQVCELPFFVHNFKQMERKRLNDRPSAIARPPADMSPNAPPPSQGLRRTCRLLPIVIRLTAPDFHDPVGGVSQADAAIASGDTMRKIRASTRPDCHDIPNGVDVHLFSPKAHPPSSNQSRYRLRHRIDPSAFVITLVGRFQTVKNHDLLIRAVRRAGQEILGIVLLLAGSGPLRESLERKADDLIQAGQVRFLGEVKHGDLPEIYHAANVNVISSDYESFCFAVLEGMASGLPHVVTATDWVPWLIGGKKVDERSVGEYASGVTEVPGGFVVPVGDEVALAAALVQLSKDPEKQRAMGAWAEQRAARDFSWDASAGKLMAIYEQLKSMATA